MALDPYKYYMIHISERLNEWKQHPDFKQKHKSFGKNKVYLFYGTKRGGEIILRFRSGSKDTHMDEAVHFMDWQNAVSEYNAIKSTKDMMDLMRRNE